MKEPDFTAEKGFRDFSTYVFLKNRTRAPKSLENINVSCLDKTKNWQGENCNNNIVQSLWKWFGDKYC